MRSWNTGACLSPARQRECAAEERSAAARFAARAGAAPAGVADAPGGALPAGILRDQGESGKFSRAVHESAAVLRGHAAADRPLSPGCGDPVLRHTDDSACDEAGAGIRKRRWADLSPPGTHSA